MVNCTVPTAGTTPQEEVKLYRARRDFQLYFGGEALLDNVNLLKRAGIRRILTVMPGIDEGDARLADFEHLVIPALDSPNQDILKYLPGTYKFIDQALENETGGVLVHCSAGISRSPTVVAGYFMKKRKVSHTMALATLRLARPEVQPNEGFIRQLKAYYDMSMSSNLLDTDGYKLWLEEQAEATRRILKLEGPPSKIEPTWPNVESSVNSSERACG